MSKRTAVFLVHSVPSWHLIHSSKKQEETKISFIHSSYPRKVHYATESQLVTYSLFLTLFSEKTFHVMKRGA